jgi:riboflavin kinase/FMN adenylyltransferase
VTDLCEDLQAGRPPGPTAVTFGVFDGVHLGHQHLMRALREAADARGLTPVVVTLTNHPLSVLRPGLPVVLLSSLRERTELLHELGIQHVIAFTFTVEISHLTPDAFMRLLCDCLGVRHMVVGPDFAIGRDREGTLPVLTTLGTELGYSVEVASNFELAGTSVRSSSVRKALAAGDLTTVQRFLGRRFALDGPVVEGEGRGGGLLGFPTANVGVGPLQALPADGIYATWLTADGQRYASATSVGIKPTFHDDAPRVVESFIIDYDGDLYDEHVRVEFVERLRDQEKFSTVEALSAQIARDVEATRAIVDRDEKEA